MWGPGTARSMSAALTHWIDAAIEACSEVGQVALAAPGLTEIARRDRIRRDLCGAFVALVGDEHRVEIGVSSTTEGCVALTRRLLCYDDSEPDPGESDVADAMGEIANMVAGGVKSAMTGVAPGLRIGLPMFVRGRVSANKRHQVASMELLLGELPVVVTLLRDP